MRAEILHGDCVDLLPLYKGQVDLVVTSPPYDNLREYDGKSEFQFEPTADALADALAPGGVICWNVQDQQKDGDFTLTSLEQALYFKSLGLKCWEKLIYKRISPRIINTRAYLRTYEYVWVFSKGHPRTVNLIQDRPNSQPGRTYQKQGVGRVGDKGKDYRNGRVTTQPFGTRSDIWEYATGGTHSSDKMTSEKHPAVMPIKLAKDLIRSFSDEGDLVLDPFAGSGTTMLAAKYLLRESVGMEINLEYCDHARSRLAQEVLL